ncbi:hypothetical protein ACFXCZ_27230 [Streptomyces sp. NPDC059396]|uniref:hypothetical protein n=1 Tax=Streptomyces sp. NPDC059396 TaxID=3346819 RepID=UPI003688D191
MKSIRSYDGTIYLCTACGQPCRDGEHGPEHFQEQWDGVYCPRFPLAAGRITVEWDAVALRDLQMKFPDTHPHLSASGTPA